MLIKFMDMDGAALYLKKSYILGITARPTGGTHILTKDEKYRVLGTPEENWDLYNDTTGKAEKLECWKRSAAINYITFCKMTGTKLNNEVLSHLE